MIKSSEEVNICTGQQKLKGILRNKKIERAGKAKKVSFYINGVMEPTPS